MTDGQINRGGAHIKTEPDPCLSSVAVFDKFAIRYADRYFDLDLYHAHLTRFASAVTIPAARVLDLACGPGNVAAFLRQIRPHWQLLGVDLAPAMLAEARKRVLGVEFALADCRELETLGRSFDAAAYAFGLSYLPEQDAKRCLASLYAVLTEGAPLYLSTISGDAGSAGWQQGSTGDSVWMAYRTVPQILQLVRQAGFMVLWHEMLASPPNAEPTHDLVLLAQALRPEEVGNGQG